MRANPIVSDEIWAAVDPHAGRLPPGQRRGVAVLAVALVVMAAVAVGGFSLGFVNPRIEVGATSWQFRPAAGVVRMRISFHEGARAAVRVLAVRIEGPGDPEVTVATRTPFTIVGRGSRSVSIAVRIRDCSAVRRADVLQVRLVIDQFWGHLTTSPDWDQGSSAHGPLFAWQACH